MCGLFLVGASRDNSSPVAVHRCLIVVASLVAERLVQGEQASAAVALGFCNAGSVVLLQGLSCPASCGVFSNQGLNLCHLFWQTDS